MEFLFANFSNIKIDHTNKYGFTALMKAAVQGQTECIHILLDNGADDAIIDPINGMCAQGIKHISVARHVKLNLICLTSSVYNVYM